MNDRELLELAAKAAGIEILDGLQHDVTRIHLHTSVGSWNPLTDDGDALRLAVKLGIDIKPREYGTDAACLAEGISVREMGEGEIATRRAIVRAAAEIGKGI